MIISKAGTDAAAPCHCKPPAAPAAPPAMTETEAGFVVRMMIGNVPFFPSDEAAQALIIDELIAMGCTIEQGTWLAATYARKFTEWNFRELRALYCSRFSPADGISTNSVVYLDGIPSDQPAPPGVLAIEPGEWKRREIEGEVSIDPELETLVKQLAKPMPAAKPRTADQIAAELYARRTPAEKESDLDRLRREEQELIRQRTAGGLTATT